MRQKMKNNNKMTGINPTMLIIATYVNKHSHQEGRDEKKKEGRDAVICVYERQI